MLATDSAAVVCDALWNLNMSVDFCLGQKTSCRLIALVFFCGVLACFGRLRSIDAQPAAEAIKPTPKNVLVLYADDWRHDSLSVAGNPVVETPVLDQMSEQAVRFTHNCVTTSICCVSRASLFTGQWMSAHGCEGFKPFKTEWSKTYPGILRDGGYYVGHVGKWHNGPFPAKHFDFGRAYHGRHWYTQEDGSKIHVTQRNENDALEFLKTRPADKPFCLTVAFFATHAVDKNPKQFLPQPSSESLYQDEEIPVPANANDESFHRLPEFLANEKNEGRNRYHWRFDTPEKYQTMMKNYYRLASEVDTTCGRIMAELEQQGVLDDTLVIFTTDNGYYHGEHGLGDKWYPHQESIRVPLIIRDPRMTAEVRGTTDDNLTLNVDLAPTILNAVGMPTPDSMQGSDLSALYLKDNSAEPVPWRTEFYYEHPTIQSKDFIPSSQAVVTKKWKYMVWPEFDREQLFDLANDPREENDLVGSEGSKLAEMRKRFKHLRGLAQTKAKFPLTENASAETTVAKSEQTIGDQQAQVTESDAADLKSAKTAEDFKKLGFKPLFNGKDLTGWRNPYKYGKASVEDGEIHLLADKKFFLVTEKKYANFRLSVDVHLPKGPANSGVMFRCHVEPNKVFGYQAECDGSDRRWSAGLYDEKRRGWIFPTKKDTPDGAFTVKESQAYFKKPEIRNALKRNGWNRYEIECVGTHIKISLNGVKVTELDDDTDASGFIGVQHHGENGQLYRFRNLYIKELPASDKPKISDPATKDTGTEEAEKATTGSDSKE